MYFTCRYNKVQESAKEDSVKADKEKQAITTAAPTRRIKHRRIKLALSAICLAFYIPCEIGWFSFATTMFQYLEIHMSAINSAHAQSLFSATYTTGRLLTAFISLKLTPDHILSYHYVAILAGLATLYFGQLSQSAIYAGCAVFGKFFMNFFNRLERYQT